MAKLIPTSYASIFGCNGHMARALINRTLYDKTNLVGYDPNRLSPCSIKHVSLAEAAKAETTFLLCKPGTSAEIMNKITQPTHIVSGIAACTIEQLRSESIVEHLSYSRFMGSLNMTPIYFFTEYKHHIPHLQFLFPSVTPIKEEQALSQLTILNGCMPAIMAEQYNVLLEAANQFGADALMPGDLNRLLIQHLRGLADNLEITSVRNLQAAVTTKQGITQTILNNLNRQRDANTQNILEAFNAGLRRNDEISKNRGL